MALLMSKSHAYNLQPAYIVICYPHHQNFRCLTCKTPLLDSIPPQTLWGTFPNPLGRLPINDVMALDKEARVVAVGMNYELNFTPYHQSAHNRV